MFRQLLDGLSLIHGAQRVESQLSAIRRKTFSLLNYLKVYLMEMLTLYHLHHHQDDTSGFDDFPEPMV